MEEKYVTQNTTHDCALKTIKHYKKKHIFINTASPTV